MALNRRTDRCLCGLRVALHFHPTSNIKLSCQDAALRHPFAVAKPQPNLAAALQNLLKR